MVTIQNFPAISGGNITKGHVFLTNITAAHGKTFFEVNKSNREIERLFLGRVEANKRVLQHAVILNECVTKRNAAAIVPKSEDDLELDEPAKRKGKKQRREQDESKIVAIELEDVDGTKCSMNILHTTNHANLLIELAPSNIEFLMKVIKRQVELASIPAEHDEEPDGEDVDKQVGTGQKHITWWEKKQSYRVKYLQDGKWRQKLIRVDDDGKDAALAIAIQFRAENCEDQ